MSISIALIAITRNMLDALKPCKQNVFGKRLKLPMLQSDDQRRPEESSKPKDRLQ